MDRTGPVGERSLGALKASVGIGKVFSKEAVCSCIERVQSWIAVQHFERGMVGETTKTGGSAKPCHTFLLLKIQRAKGTVWWDPRSSAINTNHCSILCNLDVNGGTFGKEEHDDDARHTTGMVGKHRQSAW